MTTVLFVLVLVFVIYRVSRRMRTNTAIRGMQERPYRYPVETRRSRWANRGRF
jgi:hypothetical protein